MGALSLQIVRNAGRLSALALLLAGLPGCQNVLGSGTGANLRIVDASPDAGGLDIYQGGAAFVYDLGFGSYTSYTFVSPGVSTVKVDQGGSTQVLASVRGTFAASQQYSLLIGNVAAGLQATLLTDQSTAAPAGQIAVRILDQATHLSTGVDVYLVPSGSTLPDLSPVATNVVFGANSGYINVPDGAYSVVLLPTGTVPTTATVASYSGTKATYASGAARTILLLDQQIVTNPGFQVEVLDDYDTPGST